MPVSLTIVCSLERLPSLDIYDEQKTSIDVAFGLNLSVGATGADQVDTLAPFLSPWAWKIGGVLLQWAPTGKANPPVAGTMISQNPTPVPALRKRLDDDLKKYDNPDKVKQLAAPGPGRTPASSGAPKLDGTTNGPPIPPWTPRLMHLATLPFPVPQALNLNLLFRVSLTQLKADAKPAEYFKISGDAARRQRVAADFEGDYTAAPILAASGPFDMTRSPNDDGPQSGIWTYKSGTGADAPTIAAQVKRIGINPPADSFVDMADQWIRHPAGARADYAEDWQSRLEVRMAEAFRLPEFFADYLRPATAAPAVADIGIALIADCAGPGLVGASVAQGSSFAESLLATVKNVDPAQEPFTLTRPQWTELENLSRGLYTSFQQWKDTVTTTIPSLSNCELLKAAPKAMTIQEIAVQFQRIIDQVFSTQHDETQPDLINLWALFRAQWEVLLDNATTLGDAEKSRIRQALAAHASPPPAPSQPTAKTSRLFDIRTRLAVDNMDRLWSSFVVSNAAALAADPDGLQLIETCFPAFLQYYASIRFGIDRPSVAGCTLPSGASEQALINSFTLPVNYVPQAPQSERGGLKQSLINTRAENFKKVLRPEKGAVAPDDKVPQGLTFSLGRIAPDPNGSQADILESISGFAVLMREVGAVDTSWHCLNYAEPWLDDKPLLTDPCVAPYRLHYRGNLKQALATYNNKALTADSPLNEDDLLDRYYPSDKQLTYKDAFLRFRYCGAAAYADQTAQLPEPPNYVRTPGLKFKSSYQFAAVALTNCGIPPRSVADASGWKLARTIAAGVVPDAAIIGGKTGLEYRRSVQVGGPRINAAVTDTNDPRVIPPDVSTRAREYEFFDDGTASPPRSSKVPVVLLAPPTFKYGAAGVQFAFTVRPPAVGWDCWDRWVAPTISRDTRSGVIAEIYNLTRDNVGKPPEQTVDTSLDDPAVHTRFWLELRRVQDDGKLDTASAGQRRWVDYGAPIGSGATVNAYQRAPVGVTCIISDTEEIVPTTGKDVEVHVKKGELYRLALYAAVPKTDVPRFVDGLLKADDPANPPDAGYQFLPGSYFAIEVATDALPQPKDVWKAVHCVYHIEQTAPAGKEAVRSDLSPILAASTADGRAPNGHDVSPELINFRYLHRAIATHQAWRWTGRPVTMHPALKNPQGTEAAVRVWEGREFGDRLPLESIPHPMTVLPATTRGADPLAWAKDVRAFRFDITPRDAKGRFDERGGHHRFRIEAWSRYEGIMTANASRVAIDVDNDNYEWKSLFVPSRRQDVLPPPKLKLILPLTQTEREDSLLTQADDLYQLETIELNHRTAGMLVVLNEAWFETGGLGEGIEARVDLLPSPDNSPTTPPEARRYYRQAGPDPTVNLNLFKQAHGLLSQPVSDGDQSVTFQQITGPVGHYFDADNTTALFVGTSFILPPPTLPKENGADPPTPWFMVRVSFRRALSAPTPPAGAPPDYPHPSWKVVQRYSEYTEPLWVQYLPDFSLYDRFSSHVSSLRLRIKPNPTLLDAKGNAQQVDATPSDEGIFTLYLVLTRMVSDVIGRPDQESYVATFEQAADKTTWKTVANGETFSNMNGVFRARIIEVQRPNRTPSAGGACWNSPAGYFWDQFFYTNDATCDTPARIVRISEPIDQESTSL